MYPEQNAVQNDKIKIG